VVQIIIPMSGFGERFRRAGYDVPKPLIELEGRPMIAHVLEMFPGEEDVIFVCNREHVSDPAYGMARILQELCPTGQMVTIDPHKFGPVHAIQQARDFINLDIPTVVNYCDFTCLWDWSHFKWFVEEAQCAGAIPAYRGFHPHSLGTTNYAYLRESKGWVTEIQEKQPFTEDRMNEYASSGTYYFSSGRVMLESFDQMVSRDLNVGGEFYVSLAYRTLLEHYPKVAVYPIQYFLQWGTPEDVADYRNWSETFRGLVSQPPAPTSPVGSAIVPMAGLGKRFADDGYVTPKPLIQVSGAPMVLQATRDLPGACAHAFVLRGDMPGHQHIQAVLNQEFSPAAIEAVSEVTDGQAISALLGLDAISRTISSIPEPLTFGTCDSGMLYDRAAFDALVSNPAVDVVVWAIRGYGNAIRFPHMFGWLDVEGNDVLRVSVKEPLDDPTDDPVAIGTFTFRRAVDFKMCVDHMISRDGRVNGEFYLDECVNDALEIGLCVKVFEIESYLAWGTPNDLRTFEYWQGAFDIWEGHPYRLDWDRRVEPPQVQSLRQKYALVTPQIWDNEI